MVGTRHRRAIVISASSVVEFSVAYLAWFLFTAKLDRHEAIVGAFAAAVAASAAMIVRRQRIVQVAVQGRDFALLSQVPKRIVVETFQVFWVLARVLLGRGATTTPVRDVPFEVGDTGARDSMRRALVTAVGSIAPNVLVLGFDSERGRLILHQLTPTDSAAALSEFGGSE